MKKNYFKKLLVICSVLLSTHVFCQVIIQESSIPVEGDSVVIAICNELPQPGDAGTGVSWDMSGLTENSEQYFVFENPTSTLWAEDFPSATISGRSWDGSVSYYKLDDEGLSVVGLASIINASDTFLLNYNDDEFFIGLPQSYGDMNTDGFDGTSNTLGFEVPFNGNVNLEVDGEGTLVLPNASYSNVLRYHLEREFTTTFMGSSTTTTKEQWAWWSPEYRFWLLIMETNIEPSGTSHLVWYNKDPQEIIVTHNDNLLLHENLKLHPNPCNKENAINFFWHKNEQNAQLMVFDLQGKLILSDEISLNSGINSLTLNLNSNLYLISICTTDKVSNTLLNILD